MVVSAQAHGYELTRIPQGGILAALSDDGFPPAVVVHGLKTYCNVAGEDTERLVGPGPDKRCMPRPQTRLTFKTFVSATSLHGIL